jgi:hypothetical protein
MVYLLIFSVLFFILFGYFRSHITFLTYPSTFIEQPQIVKINEIDKFLKLITINVSQKGYIVLINNVIVLNEKIRGSRIIIIDGNNEHNIKSIKPFNNINEHIKLINDTDIIIIVSNNDLTNSNLTLLGSEIESFDENANYILIGSTKDVYFESVNILSDVHYPEIKLTKSICKINTASFFPLNEYLIFKNKDGDEINKCALEANKKGYNNFGLTSNECIIMNNDDFNRFDKLKDSNECNEGYGSFDSISGYEFNKNFEEVVKIYNNDNKIIELTEGKHNIDNIKLIIVPKKYYITLSDNKSNKKITYYGPLNINSTDDYTTIIVRKIYENNVVLCDDTNGYGDCMIYGPGKHVLHEYWKIKYVNMSMVTNKVILYQDSNYINKIAEFVNDGLNSINNRTIKTIEYPKIIRSIQIL